MKRTVAILLAAVLLLGMIPMASAGDAKADAYHFLVELAKTGKENNGTYTLNPRESISGLTEDFLIEYNSATDKLSFLQSTAASNNNSVLEITIDPTGIGCEYSYTEYQTSTGAQSYYGRGSISTFTVSANGDDVALHLSEWKSNLNQSDEYSKLKKAEQEITYAVPRILHQADRILHKGQFCLQDLGYGMFKPNDCTGSSAKTTEANTSNNGETTPAAKPEKAGMDNFQKKQTYTAGQFADVKTSDWFSSGVQSAFELGLMKGSSDTAFKPTGNLTVAEALAIACRLHSIYAANGQEFTQGSPWYQVYVDYAVTNKIMKEGLLDPTKTITREQFAYLMCGAIPETDLNVINTITVIPDEAEKSTYGGFVYRLYRAGVLTGSDKYGTFKPTTAIQRSEVATIVTRIADRSQRKTFKLEKKPVAVTGIQLAGNTQIMVGDSTIWDASVIPANATNTSLSWSAGNPSVATVDEDGYIMGHKAGQCNITVTAANGVKKTVMITVKDSFPESISLSGDTTIEMGTTVQWTADLLPNNVSNKQVTWSSGNPGVASVDQNGKIKGIKEGKANITATTANGIKKTVLLTVIKHQNITVNGTSIRLNSADGVNISIGWKNNSYKSINYVHFFVNVYDLNWALLKCDIWRYTEFDAWTSGGPFAPGFESRFYWDAIMYNGRAAHFKINRIMIEYADGSKETIKNPLIWY